MKRQGVLIAIGMAGVAVFLAGLSLDAVLHAQDPGLAHREGVFALTNPGHVLMGAGFLLIVVGLTGASITMLASRRAQGCLTAVTLAALAVTSLAVTLPNRPATPAERAAAQQLWVDTIVGTAPFRDPQIARAAGYRPVTNGSPVLVDFLNDRYLRAGRVLDTNHPERLIYVATPGGLQLAGVMYVMPAPGMHGPDIGGPLTIWHTHSDLCENGAGMVVGTNAFGGRCPRGSALRETPEMLHVWVVTNANGQFAETLANRTVTWMVSG